MLGLQSSHRIVVPSSTDAQKSRGASQLLGSEAGLRRNSVSDRVGASDRVSEGGAVAFPASAEQEFREAIRTYQEASGRMFPTWSEVLEVLQGLGYRKAQSQNP